MPSLLMNERVTKWALGSPRDRDPQSRDNRDVPQGWEHTSAQGHTPAPHLRDPRPATALGNAEELKETLAVHRVGGRK